MLENYLLHIWHIQITIKIHYFHSGILSLINQHRLRGRYRCLSTSDQCKKNTLLCNVNQLSNIRFFYCTALYSRLKQHAAHSLVPLRSRLTLGKCPRPESPIPTVSRLSHRDFPTTPELDNKLCTSRTYVLQVLGGRDFMWYVFDDLLIVRIYLIYRSSSKVEPILWLL